MKNWAGSRPHDLQRNVKFGEHEMNVFMVLQSYTEFISCAKKFEKSGKGVQGEWATKWRGFVSLFQFTRKAIYY